MAFRAKNASLEEANKYHIHLEHYHFTDSVPFEPATIIQRKTYVARSSMLSTNGQVQLSQRQWSASLQKSNDSDRQIQELSKVLLFIEYKNSVPGISSTNNLNGAPLTNNLWLGTNHWRVLNAQYSRILQIVRNCLESVNPCWRR